MRKEEAMSTWVPAEPDYWPNPPKPYLVKFFSDLWPARASEWRKSKLRRLRAIWHSYNQRRNDGTQKSTYPAAA